MAAITWGHWLLAARPKTLIASMAPVTMGTSLAAYTGNAHALAAAAAALGALSIQIGTNFCNDYFDFVQGADTDERTGPTRAVQAGLIAPRAMLAGAVLMFAATCLVSVYLCFRAGWPLLLIGGASIICGVLYTAGRFSLAYLGLGDPFVLVFFGPVAVAGTYYVQALSLTWPIVIAGLAPGLLATGLLVVNNLRDVTQDRVANKRTLVVRLGVGFGRAEYAVCILGAALVPVVLSSIRFSNGVLLAALVAVPGTVLIRRVWSGSGAALVPCLGKTAGLLLLYTVLFCLGLFWGERGSDASLAAGSQVSERPRLSLGKQSHEDLSLPVASQPSRSLGEELDAFSRGIAVAFRRGLGRSVSVAGGEPRSAEPSPEFGDFSKPECVE